MILLDTNVISELMRVAPSPAALAWLNQCDAADLYLSAVTIGEIQYGLRVVPEGSRRADLTERFERFLRQAFEDRVCNFDEAAARSYGDIMARRRELGRPMSVPDGQNAAIARSCGHVLATRNVRDFEGCGLEVLDPFKA